ncbi:MAG: DUF86 domain-containing protein [Cellulomonadaceae bacterium]|jgi:uncharacterized protein with HEPN domain|nr:DUF86 domain-containing protein [Cellulomonadaceae bacterium]
MDRKTAKELLHIRDWLSHAAQIVDGGQVAYNSSMLAQEAGDSLLMKLGEACRRLDHMGFTEPSGVNLADAIATRNWVIHRYDNIDRDLTWHTLATNLPQWQAAFASLFTEAEAALRICVD